MPKISRTGVVSYEPPGGAVPEPDAVLVADAAAPSVTGVPVPEEESAESPSPAPAPEPAAPAPKMPPRRTPPKAASGE